MRRRRTRRHWGPVLLFCCTSGSHSLSFTHLFFSPVFLSVSHAAKHHRLPQPGRPERLPLPAGRHGGPPVHAAAGEGRADGRNGGSQRPARGTARRGRCSSSSRLLAPSPLRCLSFCFFHSASNFLQVHASGSIRCWVV